MNWRPIDAIELSLSRALDRLEGALHDAAEQMPVNPASLLEVERNTRRFGRLSSVTMQEFIEASAKAGIFRAPAKLAFPVAKPPPPPIASSHPRVAWVSMAPPEWIERSANPCDHRVPRVQRNGH